MTKHQRHNPFLYPAIEARRLSLKATFNAAAAGMKIQRAMVELAEAYHLAPKPYAELAKDTLDATIEMTERAVRDYPKPEFGLVNTQIDGHSVGVTEEVVKDMPFGNLLHFKRDTNRNDPKLLIVIPMSGHYATLLRDTVRELLPNHDVYVTDWKNAREVPLKEGDFGLDDYINYVKDFIRTIGPETHVMAVCQPTVATMAAVSELASENSDVQPLTMTLMAGPIDVRAAETEVTKLAESKPIEWFERNVIGQVPANYPGAGRYVYPGFVQLFSFMAMNPQTHMDKHVQLYNDLLNHEFDKAEKTKKFYDEYFAVADLSAKFYLETVQKVFIDPQLAKGTLEHDGHRVDPSATKKTALFTIEGSEDDISAPGQTIAAQALAANVPATERFHYVQEGVGHYGTFSGQKWRDGIAPRITGFIRAMAAEKGVTYDPAAKSVMPEAFTPLAPAQKAPKKAPKPKA